MSECCVCFLLGISVHVLLQFVCARGNSTPGLSQSNQTIQHGRLPINFVSLAPLHIHSASLSV